MSKKTYLITGASSDMGLDFIKSICEQDVNILGLYNSSSEGLEAVKSEAKANIVPMNKYYSET